MTGRATLRQGPAHRLPSQYVDWHANGDMPFAGFTSIGPGQMLRPDAAAAWRSLQQAAVDDLDAPIGVTDSYRSHKAQVAVKAAKGGLAATPGH